MAEIALKGFPGIAVDSCDDEDALVDCSEAAGLLNESDIPAD